MINKKFASCAHVGSRADESDEDVLVTSYYFDYHIDFCHCTDTYIRTFCTRARTQNQQLVKSRVARHER